MAAAIDKAIRAHASDAAEVTRLGHRELEADAEDEDA